MRVIFERRVKNLHGSFGLRKPFLRLCKKITSTENHRVFLAEAETAAFPILLRNSPSIVKEKDHEYCHDAAVEHRYAQSTVNTEASYPFDLRRDS